jgi:4-hydroxy-2-oxoheptanedioate aldolase
MSDTLWRLGSKLQSQDLVLGSFIYLRDPAATAAAAAAGMDFVVIDLEHTSLSLVDVEQHVAAAQFGGIAPIVRVAEPDPKLIARLLDLGAEGILVAQVHTVADAQAAAAAVRYPPVGNRGMCRVTRATNYTESAFDAYAARAQPGVTCMVLIESVEGCENTTAIAAVDGVDVVMPGRGDLSASAGLLGALESDRVNALAEQVIVDTANSGRAVPAMVIFRPDELRRWQSVGANVIVFSQDSRLLANSYAEKVAALRSIAAARATVVVAP